MLFAEISGYTGIKNKLIRTVLNQRVSHAQLFYGPENSSKLALAIAYAQFINCTNRTIAPGITDITELVADSCGECPSCVKYQKLAHPDLHFIYPVATTKKVSKKPQSKFFIEDWRNFLLNRQYHGDLQDWYETIGLENKQGIINAEDCNEIITTLSYKSYEADYKVMVLWMVEKLFYAAAPKLLKILEEPPEKTLFILVAEDPNQMINTIVSRTLMVRIPSMEFSRAGGGADEPIHFNRFREWMRFCYGAKVSELIGFTQELARAGRENQKSFLIAALRTVGYCNAANFSNPVPSGLSADEAKFVHDFSPFIRDEKMAVISGLLNDAIYHIERNAHPATLFLDLSFKIIRLFKPNFVHLQGL